MILSKIVFVNKTLHYVNNFIVFYSLNAVRSKVTPQCHCLRSSNKIFVVFWKLFLRLDDFKLKRHDFGKQTCDVYNN